MRVHCVTAEQLGVAPLFTEGPLADFRYKFVLIENELVYGNARHHWDLVGWLLQGPLAVKYPPAVARAQPIIESERVLTVFGGLDLHGKIEMVVYITPCSMTIAEVERLITDAFQSLMLVKEVA